jgi:hypothetical protein
MGVVVKTVRKVTRRNEKTKQDVVIEKASFRRGDECVCPGCGAVVIAHFGDSYEGETRTPDYTVQA